MLIEASDDSAAKPLTDPRREDVTVLLWAAIPVIVFITWALQVFEMLSLSGCEGVCDLDLIFGAREAYPWALGISVAAALAAAGVLKVRGHGTFWAALLGVILVLSSGIVAGALVQIGLSGMYERNARYASGDIPPSPPPPTPVGTWNNGTDDRPYLQFRSDGTLLGNDGCNDLTTKWTQDANGKITFGTFSSTANECEGTDTWLSKGRSGIILDNYLYINGSAATVIGGLQSAD